MLISSSMTHVKKLLKFAKDSYNMFLNGTIEDKRFITQTVLSNATYYDGKLDVELHPAFDILFRLSKKHEHKKSTFEPSKSIDFTNKKDPIKGQFVNGGADDARFELFKKFYEHMKSVETTNIVKLINTLKFVA